jgi:hypothetical protein
MKTLLKISKDNFSNLSYDMFIEDVNYLVNELNVHCEVKNNNYINIVEQQKRYSSNSDEYNKHVVIEARGYSQSDWQTYVLYYNEDELNTPMHKSYFESLVKQLKRSFTHFNEYYCEKFEYIESNGKQYIENESFDSTVFCIDTIEFPSEEDVKQEYIGIYGIDYDTIEINIK